MLGIELVEETCDMFSRSPQERDGWRQGLSAGRGNEEIETVPRADPGNGIRKIIEFLEFFPVFCVPRQVLVAEVVHRTDFIAGLVCRLRNMAGGKTGNQHPALHIPSVCLPAFDGMMRICAPGNSFFSSVPQNRWSRKRARLEISEWGWPVTATLKSASP